MNGRGHFIAGNWMDGGTSSFASTNPATGQALWQGPEASGREINQAMAAARAAFADWAALPVDARISHLLAFADQLRARRAGLAETICQETGKPRWESLGEVDSMVAKVDLSVQAYHERRHETGSDGAWVRYRPLGVLAVFGPFNFPGHLPNGHIVPALLAGNTIVFKPSEMTPLVAEKTVEAWIDAGLPPGVLNLVQGGRETGRHLADHPDLNGLLFTGSVAAGLAIHRAFAGYPEKLLALEMGGNNPLVVWQAEDLRAAAYLTIQSAYITAGQRCSCARRLIVEAGPAGDRFVEQLAEAIGKVRVGPYTDEPQPFMGPVISARAGQSLLDVQEDLRERGGIEIVPMMAMQAEPRTLNPTAFLRPGLMDVSAIRDREDTEHFGPFLQLIRVASFDAAVREANHTAFGLCAGLLSDSPELYDRFRRSIRAGVVNWNRPTTGASSRLPFGGLGVSGNHRPSGFFACDYCSDPVASLESGKLAMPASPMPGIDV